MKIKNENNETMKAGSIVLNEGKILLVTIPDQNNWSFPKGHMEEGETKEYTARREILEETGYEIELLGELSNITYTHKESGEAIRIFMFLSKVIRKVDDGESDIEKRWFSIEEAEEKLPVNLSFILKEIKTDL
ncbi:MAG: NUDIX domain-containing protein [Candidatus Paceibacterota bacterium]|jgi:8-oxo-dGTP pyrophosphatase MutT (NUDIX family)